MKQKLTFALLTIMFIASFTSCSFFNQNSSIELIPFRSGNDYQYVDTDGKIVINPQFADATIFRDGLALVKTNGEKGGYGFINDEGKFIINPTYMAATVFSEGLAWVVSENGAPTAINTKGEVKFSVSNAERAFVFSEGMAAFTTVDSTGEKYGFVDDNGTVKISPQFNFAGNFKDGKAVVLNKEGKHGYIDKAGKLVISYQFDDASAFSQGYAAVKLKNKAGTIDQDGRYVVNPQFEEILIDDNRLLVRIDNKWGWCDLEGKLIINPQFEDASLFGKSDLAAVKSGGKWGYIDRDGKFSINAQFEGAFPFNNGIAVVSTGEQYGIINEKGIYVANPQFKSVARDFIFYVTFGSTAYNEVQTDYFNINAIADNLNLLAPEGITLNNTISQIIDKLNLNPDAISKYGNQTQIFSGKQLSNEATLSFTISGNFYAMNEDTWDYGLQPNKTPDGLYYRVDLSGKGIGKHLAIKDALSKKLNGLKLVKAGKYFGKDVTIYRDNTKYIVSEYMPYRIEISILKLSHNLNYMISKIRANEDSNADVNADMYDTAPVGESAAEEPHTYEEYPDVFEPTDDEYYYEVGD